MGSCRSDGDGAAVAWLELHERTYMIRTAIALPILFVALLLVLQAPLAALAIAILLDALIVRPVLLPAAVEVLGRRGWWPTSRSAPPPPAVAEREPELPQPAREPEVPVGA